MSKILVILASTRPTRVGGKIADWFLKYANDKKPNDMQLELVDLAELNLPILNEPEIASSGIYKYDHTKAWSAKVNDADGFIIVTPEYNHGYSASLKNALDYLYGEWNKKPVGFVGYGYHWGLRSVEQLRMICLQLQMVPLTTQVEINIGAQIDEQGVFTPTSFDEKHADGLLSQLEWWVNVLTPARDKK